MPEISPDHSRMKLNEMKAGQPKSDKLVAVWVNGKKHQEYIKAGWRCHHLDGQVVYLEPPKQKPAGG